MRGGPTSGAEIHFLFLRILRARFPRAGDFQQRLAVLSAHLARDTETIRRVFSEFVGLLQPRLLSPRQGGNVEFWNFVLQQYCDVKLPGTNGPGPDFYRCVSGRLGCRCFPLSIIVDMPRNASGWRNRSPTPMTRFGSWTWPKRSANSPKKTMMARQVRWASDRTPTPFFRQHGTEGRGGCSPGVPNRIQCP